MLALAAALVALAVPLRARAQFHAPKTVEELENDSHKKKGGADQVDESEGLPTDTGPEDVDETPPKPLPDELPAQPRPQQPAQKPPEKPAEKPQPPQPTSQRKPEAPDAGARAPVASSAADGGLITEAPPIALPKASVGSILDAWSTRRKAVQDHNPKAMEAAEKQILQQREELGIHDLGTLAGALDQEAAKRLEAKDPAEANRLADLAVALAPDLSGPRLAQAHIRWSADVGNVGGYLGALQDGISRIAGMPAPRRAVLGNLGAAAALGLALAALLTVLALALRPMRYALHDFHHLFPRGALPFQTAVLFVLLLMLPWAFKLGPLTEVAALVCASFLYLRPPERTVATVLLAALAVLPLAAGAGARELAYSGSLGEALVQAQLGGPDAAPALARLEALEKAGQADASVLTVLGLSAKRAGLYPRAIERFKKALAQNPRSAEAQNDLGNALLLSGDLDGAREAYLKASELAPDSAPVNYNLAKLLARRAQLFTGQRDVSADIEAGKAATAAVSRLDRSLMDRPADNRANLYVLDLEVAPPAAAPPEANALGAAVSAQLETYLWGSSAPQLSQIIAAGLLGFFWLLSFGARRFKPCTECSRCGRPVCARCDREVAGGSLCGQCHNAFVKRNAVDPPTRLAKEASAKKYQERWQSARRLASYCVAGLGHLLAGRPIAGAIFLVLAGLFAGAVLVGDGLFRLPLGGSLSTGRQVAGAVFFLAVWIFSIRSYRQGEERRT